MESPQQSGQMYVSASNIASNNNKKKRMIWVLIVVLGIAAIVAAAYFLTKGSERVDADEPVNTVTIDANGFTPSTIKIKKGQELAWVNSDSTNAHEVTADQEDAPGLGGSGPLAEGDTYIYEFEKAGTINYYDPLNPTKYKGTVIVE
jgi:plastocyanin